MTDKISAARGHREPEAGACLKFIIWTRTARTLATTTSGPFYTALPHESLSELRRSPISPGSTSLDPTFSRNTSKGRKEGGNHLKPRVRMSESSPTRQSRYLDDPRTSRRSSIDLRQHALLSTTIPSLASGQEWHRNPVFAPPASLLNSRRSSMVSLYESVDRERNPVRGRASRVEVAEAHASTVATEPASPEDGSSFRRSLQIDMRSLVGDAVGNMSISPSSRDVVLAARRGLFIIDLEAPLEVPRFLPQGGTWDVADVQWNPHPSRAEYIVSTSSEKLLIWNLLLVGKTSIEFILQAHYRAITDINWHTTECDTVISTGIDSWLWAWDLREPRKPIFGLSAFEAGGTQVKWNRQDGNIIASSHYNEVLIWDRRKGSLPINRIKAHTSKIYGIDWAHDRRDELVTCSLDKTVKVWDTSLTTPASRSTFTSTSAFTPTFTSPAAELEPGLKATIHTAYPVWRARNLPFGRGGVLSLAQRGETALEMYAYEGARGREVGRFEGHTDVVKEFVWRRGGDDEFQLITWSKDRTLRFWPVEPEVMQQVGHTPRPQSTLPRESSPSANNPHNISYRNPPEGTGYLPLLSAPVGHRSILAEVRAPLPPLLPPTQQAKAKVGAGVRSQGGTMSRGNPNPGRDGGRGGRMAMDAFTWLSNVKVGERGGAERGAERERRESSEAGAGGGRESAEVSRLRGVDVAGMGMGSVVEEGLVIGEMDGERERGRRSGESRVRMESEVGQSQSQNQSLQDEITSVISKFAPSKVRLEKHDLTKKRTCTLGLHGPWGGTSSVFIRVTFTFPRDYPQAAYPGGIPIVELERNPLITLKDRAFMLRRLTAIREHRRPCLESCLRFLLFRDEEERPGEPLPIDPETSSSDEEEGLSVAGRRTKDAAVTVLRGNKNLVEPRTSQGTFGPNGELVCFFRAPTRIVRNVLRGLSDSPATPNEEPASAPPASAEPAPAPRMFQSPSLISDAVRRLGLSAKDRQAKASDATRRLGDRHNILRIMTNLLTLQPKPKSSSLAQVPDGQRRPLGDLLKSYALLAAPRRSTVFIENTTNIAGGDRKVAVDYVFGEPEGVGRVGASAGAGEGGLKEVCARNARAAKLHGRYDHERAFKMLQALLPASSQTAITCSALALKVIMGLYDDFAKNKDIQMLAMLSVLLLQVHEFTAKPALTEGRNAGMDLRTSASKFTGVDYFSIGHHLSPQNERPPAWPRRPSPPTLQQQQQLAASLSSSNSSRGSWSSLFNTGSVRQFMSGVQDTLLPTPHETPSMTTVTSNPSAPGSSSGSAEIVFPAFKLDKISRVTEGRRKKQRKEQARPLTAPTPPVAASKSWNETTQPQPQPHPFKPAPSFSSAAHRRTPLAQVTDPNNSRAGYKRTIVFEPAPEPITESPAEVLTEGLLEQIRMHVHVYADLLCRWQLYHKRLELLKAAKRQAAPLDGNRHHTIGLTPGQGPVQELSSMLPCHAPFVLELS
ncbi:putative WD40 repeats [Lyophyllum shimeji]|uniref:WD40 repeats n=1 Tax=Lyophyllum shimeji TaxID=47721 RepID=A0A9P3PK08_LYOSH|nr:putative WD40 repeats [Lyophyllum shimeji]